MKQSWNDFLYLVSCALNRETPELSKVEKMDMEALYRLAKEQSLLGLVAMTVEDAGRKIEGNWLQAKEKVVRKSLLLDAEYQRVVDALEQQGIWHMPLKGRILQDYYPKKGMRQMADADILFDASCREQVHSLFLEWGYEVKVYGFGSHDAYLKEPVYNFEMHVSLYDGPERERFQSYYAGVKERLKKVEGKASEFCFTDEDFYIYFITHAYKHHAGAGTGLRTLTDWYVYLKEKEDSLDWEYVRNELQKLGVAEYEEESRRLCSVLFAGNLQKNLSEEEERTLSLYLSSATYGTEQRHVESTVKKLKEEKGSGLVRWSYIRNRLFPEKSVLEFYCPAAREHKMLLIYAWFKRALKVVTKNKSIRRELKYVDSALKKESVQTTCAK